MDYTPGQYVMKELTPITNGTFRPLLVGISHAIQTICGLTRPHAKGIKQVLAYKENNIIVKSCYQLSVRLSYITLPCYLFCIMGNATICGPRKTVKCVYVYEGKLTFLFSLRFYYFTSFVKQAVICSKKVVTEIYNLFFDIENQHKKHLQVKVHNLRYNGTIVLI